MLLRLFLLIGPSPDVWETYISYREECAGATVEKVSFRSKAYGWKRYSIEMDFIRQT
jgi:hypothetical protein